MHSPTNYAIFWLPSGYHFDTPALDVPYANASDANYEGLIDRYLRDVSNTTLYSILQQYTDAAGAPGLSTTFGGSWVYSAPYPNAEGTVANPLQDADIQTAVTAAMAANHWPADNGTNEFFVFTGIDAYSCAGQDCSYDGYCSYHSAFGAADGETVIYAYIPDPGSANAESCLATRVTGQPAPNGAAFADSAVNLLAHEEFESVTDPQFDGWYSQDVQHEIADLCAWSFGQVGSDGSDVVLGGHRYLIQEMWDNALQECYLPPVLPTVAVLTSYSVAGGATGPLAPTFAYLSGGTYKAAKLSTSPTRLSIDEGTTWNVSGTLAGSNSTDRWATPLPTRGNLTSAGAPLAFVYYHQYLVKFGFALIGGGTVPQNPEVDVSQFGVPAQAMAGSPVWVDAGSQYSYASPLNVPGQSERWAAANQNGTLDSGIAPVAEYALQYEVNFAVVDASGSRLLYPSLLQIETARPTATVNVQQYQTWLDSGSDFTVDKVIWEGVDVTPSNITSVVNSPTNFTVVARVYDVSLRVTDYLGLPVAGASARITLANGTELTRVTDKSGTIMLSSVPLGSYDASISSFGLSQRVSADTPEEGGQTRVIAPASIPDLGALAVVILVILASAFYVARRRRMYWL